MARYQEQEEAMEQKREKEKAENSFEAKELSPEVREAVEHGRVETSIAASSNKLSNKFSNAILIVSNVFRISCFAVFIFSPCTG